jgi:hypothetical protein
VVDGLMVWDGRELVLATPHVRVVAGKQRPAALAGRYDPDAARWSPIAELSPLDGRPRLAWAGAAVVELSSDAVHDPASDHWLPLPEPPSGADPPVPSAGPERALVRIDSRSRPPTTSHPYVLEPANPEP